MILDGLLKSLKGTFKNCRISVISANPQATEKEHHVKSVRQIPAGLRSLAKAVVRPPLATLRAIRRCDLFVLGGGGLFASQSQKANLIWWLQTLPAIIRRKPIAILGQSLGKPATRLEKFIIKSIFKRACFISVRDSVSKEHLKSLGIKKKIHLAPDFALYLKQPTAKIHAVPPTATIALRHTSNWPATLEKDLVDFCNWLIEDQNLVLKFINFQEGPHGDNEIHTKIISQIRESYCIQHIQNPTSAEEITEIIAQSKLLLGMRLHSIITAIKTSTPFIAISYGEKITNLLKDAHLKQNILTLENVSLENLKEKYQNLKTPTQKDTQPSFNTLQQDLKRSFYRNVRRSRR